MPSVSSAVPRPPLQGYNHNIRYQGRVYHVQSEDSGVQRPHLITHLFLEGMIVATLRTDYADQAQGPADPVRRLMQEQHKSMMRRLRRGELDAQIASLAEGDAPVPAAGVLTEQEQSSFERGQRISQQTAALVRSSGVVPAELPEFGAIPLVEMEGEDEEALELDLEAIAALDLDDAQDPAPARPPEPGEELDLDEWDNAELTPPRKDVQDLLQVTVTPSTGPARRVRRPSLPQLPPGKPVDEELFHDAPPGKPKKKGR